MPRSFLADCVAVQINDYDFRHRVKVVLDLEALKASANLHFVFDRHL
jgi:hypothetical protein